MAAFSSFQHLDSSSLSVFLPNSSSSPSPPPPFTTTTINKMYDPNNASISHFYQHTTDINHHDSSLLNVNATSNKNSMDSSLSVVTHPNKRKSTSPINSAQSKDMSEVKGKKKKKEKAKECEEGKKQGDEAPTGYIHVRARRGQATDSHSLAERVRRERISERMKLLQALVPGCDKVTGKALMLDEIINYVQSLQNQVEFLSMKLASFNPIPIFYDFGMDLESSYMIRPDQKYLNSLGSPMAASMQECNPTTANTYPVLDNSVTSLLLHQSQIPNALPQVLWEVDDQRQKIINNSLFSFPLM